MKILWVSDCPDNRVHTGYATATRQIALELIKRGHSFVFGSQGSQDANIQDIQVGPHTCRSYGFGKGQFLSAQAIFEINEHENPDVIITMADWQMVENMIGLSGSPAFSKWICYAPVDGDMLTSFWDFLIYHIPTLVYMSPKFGPRVCQSRRFGYVDYVPLPVELDQHFIMPDKERGELKFTCKTGAGWSPTTKTVLTVARNQWRKNYPEIIKAAAILNKSNPGLYSFVLHCRPVEPMGWDLPRLVKYYNVGNCVAISDQELPPDQKHKLYNSADVFLLPSLGEGFGIPIVEAALYKIPVLTTNDTAGRDLTEIIKCEPMNLDFDTNWQHGPTIPRPLVTADVIAKKLLELEQHGPQYDLAQTKHLAEKNFCVNNICDKWEQIILNHVASRNRAFGIDPTLGEGDLALPKEDLV